MSQENDGNQPVVVTRRFDASPELVFRMWTKPEYLRRWFAPRRCALQIHHFDFRVGGRFRTTIADPDGNECRCAGVFKEIHAPERIVFTMYFSDDEFQLVSPQALGMDPQWPDESLVTITFEEAEEGQTLMTLSQTVPEALAKRTGAYAGWVEMFDRLEENLEAVRL